MSDFFHSGWSIFVAAATVIGLVWCLWLLFVASQRNYFHAIDTRAEEIAAEIAKAGSAAEWLRSTTGVRVRFLPPDVMMDALRRHTYALSPDQNPSYDLGYEFEAKYKTR